MNTLWTARMTLVVALAAAWGCDRAESTRRSSTGSEMMPRGQGVTNAQPPSVATEQSPGGAPDFQTVDVLADAWCEQQRSCDRVGANRTYDSFATCTSELRGVVHVDLRDYDCPRGVDPARAQACEAKIERVDCGHTLVTLASLGECTREQLCSP